MNEDRLAYVKKRLDRINKVIDELWQLAESDEVVTPDEQRILENVQTNLDNYKRMANHLSDGNDISEADLEKLYVFEKKIVQSASSEALDDGYISEEEGDLLQYLLDFFTELNE